MKILENCLQNVNCCSWIKLVSVLIHLKYCTAIPHPWSFLIILAIYVKLHPGQLKLLFNTTLIILFIGFSILSYPLRPQATIIGYTKPNAKPDQSNLLSSYLQMIIPFWSNTLPIKKLSL